MNNVALVGRLYKDVELKTGSSGKSIARTGIAVQRDYKNANGNYDADFINLIAFGSNADFLAKYFQKGSQISIIGKIQTGSYTNKDNQKVYTTDVVVNSAEFVESKKSKSEGNNSASTQTAPSAAGDGFMNISDGIEEELPFN